MDKEYDYKIRYTLNDNDYFEFNKIHLLLSETGKKALLNYKLSVPVLTLILIGFIAILRFDTGLIIIELIAMDIIDIIWVLLSDKIYFRQLKKSFAKLKKDGSLPYDKSGELIFDSDAITDITENSVEKKDYSVIEKIITTEKTVYLYTSAINAYIINSDFFKDENEKSDFRDYIISKAINAQIIKK